MNAEKKIKFNPKSGMALPSVIIILFIVSMLGTAMYALSYDSLKSIRYASDTKKAQYLARAGVEATASAYQLAVSNPYTVDGVSDFLAAGNNADITSNNVYLVYDKEEENVKARYKFVTETEVASYASKYVIGHYDVVIKNEDKLAQVKVRPLIDATDPDATPTTVTKTITSKIKVIKATGYAGNAKEDIVGYLEDAKMAKGAYYGSNGIIDGQYTDDHQTLTQTNVSGKTYKSQATEVFFQSGSYKTSSKLYFKYKWLNQLLGEGIQPDPIDVGSRTIPLAVGYSAGNLIFDQPSSDNKIITFLKGQDNIVTFTSGNNLFVRSDIDVTSSDGKFNFITLKGKNIVIDGNVALAAYCFTRNNTSSFANNVGTLSDLLSAKYRYSTITIAATEGYSDQTYNSIYRRYKDDANMPYDFTDAGKVFFGGNVYVSIDMPNVGTHNYRAFSAGDVYYFDANPRKSRYELLGQTYEEDSTTGSAGVDLFRYFLEKSIAEKRYSSNVLKRFADLINFYYGSTVDDAAASGNPDDDQTIITKNIDGKKVAIGLYLEWEITNLNDSATSTGVVLHDAMRKIQPDLNSPNCYKYDKVTHVVPPNPADASGVKWGEPGT